ncbi:psp operon transcriptional activator [compost metagenome]
MAEEYGDQPKTFKADAMEHLKSLPWTGNVRELRNVVERLVIMCGQEITIDEVKLYAGLGL